MGAIDWNWKHTEDKHFNQQRRDIADGEVARGLKLGSDAHRTVGSLLSCKEKCKEDGHSEKEGRGS